MHRRYNSGSTRFEQPDPYNGSYNLTNPQSFNRYAYVNNDPVNFVDPSGQDPPDPRTPAIDPATGRPHPGGVPGPTGVVDVIDGRSSGLRGGRGNDPNFIPEEGPEANGGLGGALSELFARSNPEDFRRGILMKFLADINRCIREIFGDTAKRMPTQTIDLAPALDVTVNGRELANRSDMAGKVRSIISLPDPKKGPNGTVFIQSGAWNLADYPTDVLEGAYIHEYGNLPPISMAAGIITSSAIRLA